MIGEQEHSSKVHESGWVLETNGRTALLLGTEPTDGFPLGTTVGGVIVADPNGSLWKLLVGPIKQACWTGPRFPNRTTDFISSNSVVNCSAEGKLGCLYQVSWRIESTLLPFFFSFLFCFSVGPLRIKVSLGIALSFFAARRFLDVTYYARCRPLF